MTIITTTRTPEVLHNMNPFWCTANFFLVGQIILRQFVAEVLHPFLGSHTVDDRKATVAGRTCLGRPSQTRHGKLSGQLQWSPRAI